MSTGPLVFIIALLGFAGILTVSTLMRLADIERRLESAERSIDRLSKVWWEGVARNHGYTVERDDQWPRS